MRGGGLTESELHTGKELKKSLSTRITKHTKNLESFLKKDAFSGLSQPCELCNNPSVIAGLTRKYEPHHPDTKMLNCSGHPELVSGSHRKIAFTLAEVLITLGIIGIVAAMTLPTLIQKNEERVTVTKVKKFYSIMNQALLMAIKDNGYVDEWNTIENSEDGVVRSSTFASYIVPYLKVSKICGEDKGCLGYTKKVTLLSGTQHNTNYETNKTYYKLILADGSYMWIRRNLDNNSICTGTDLGLSNVCGAIFLDVNGKKEPNTIGKDIFVFYVQKARIITANQDCNSSSSGWGCTTHILQHNDMKYLHK